MWPAAANAMLADWWDDFFYVKFYFFNFKLFLILILFLLLLIIIFDIGIPQACLPAGVCFYFDFVWLKNKQSPQVKIKIKDQNKI